MTFDGHNIVVLLRYNLGFCLLLLGCLPVAWKLAGNWWRDVLALFVRAPWPLQFVCITSSRSTLEFDP